MRGVATPQCERASLQTSPWRMGYKAVRCRRSHVRVTAQVNGEYHELLPLGSPINAKTLSSILKGVAEHHGTTVQELLHLLDMGVRDEPRLWSGLWDCP